LDVNLIFCFEKGRKGLDGDRSKFAIEEQLKKHKGWFHFLGFGMVESNSQ